MKLFHQKNKKNADDQKWIELLKKNGYPEKQIESIFAKLVNLPEDLKNALLEWDSFGKLPDVSSEGFTASELVDGFGLTPIAAIMMLDWLRRDPEEAKTALAQPISRIVIGENSMEEILKAEKSDQES